MPRKKAGPQGPPRLLDSARLLQYAVIDASIGFRGRTLLFVDGKELGRVPQLDLRGS